MAGLQAAMAAVRPVPALRESPQAVAAPAAISAASRPTASRGAPSRASVSTEIVGSEVDRWFLALDQGFESAAMNLVTRDPSVSPNGKLKNVPVSIDDFDLI